MSSSVPHFPNFREAYLDVVADVMHYGSWVKVRGEQTTRELVGYQLKIEDPTHSLLTGMNRNINLGIAAGEAAQLIGGVSDPQLMTRVSPTFARFLDAGIFHGAYGPRIKSQLPALVSRLMDDRTSRQALLTIWRPQDDLFTDARDLPCTLTLQFLIRDNKLHMVVNMRSNDVFWGLTYDVFQFTQLQCTLANLLHVGYGTYTHNAGSMHIYERDTDAIAAVTPPTDEGRRITGFSGWDRPRKIIQWVGTPGATIHTQDDAEVWYVNALMKYRAQ